MNNRIIILLNKTGVRESKVRRNLSELSDQMRKHWKKSPTAEWDRTELLSKAMELRLVLIALGYPETRLNKLNWRKLKKEAISKLGPDFKYSFIKPRKGKNYGLISSLFTAV